MPPSINLALTFPTRMPHGNSLRLEPDALKQAARPKLGSETAEQVSLPLWEGCSNDL